MVKYQHLVTQSHFRRQKCTGKQLSHGNLEKPLVPANRDVERKRNSICLAHPHFDAEQGTFFQYMKINIAQIEKNCAQEQLMPSYFNLFSMGDQNFKPETCFQYRQSVSLKVNRCTLIKTKNVPVKGQKYFSNVRPEMSFANN